MQQENNKKKSIIITSTILIITAIIVAVSVTIIMQKKPEQPPVEEEPVTEQPGEVTGFDPGHPLEDNEDLDKDRSAEYSVLLKLYIKLDEEMSYDDLNNLVKTDVPGGSITLGSDYGKIFDDGTGDVISFDYAPDTKNASFFNFAHSIKSENVVRIVKLEDGNYEFGNDALSGIYSNKNRAINAYLYYMEKYNEYGKKEEK